VKKAMPIKIKDMILYSVPEVAQKLNVTTVTIRNYLRQEKLKGQKLMGRWFISEEDLVEFFEKLQ
jgi:excisionase family DNA binding protein